MITNKFNYPQAIVDLIMMYEMQRKIEVEVAKSKYPGLRWISVTSLIDSPYIQQMRESGLEPLQDVSNAIYQIFGTAIHDALEKSSPTYLKEVRIEKIFPAYKIVISGRMDLFDPATNTLSDWKVTSKYTKIEKQKWGLQLNVLKYLIEEELGIKVENLEINTILRDFNSTDAFKESMPDRMIQTHKVPIMTEYEINKYIKDRIELHSKEYFGCSPKDRWCEFAVKKVGGAKAISGGVKETEEEAKLMVMEMQNPGDYFVEARKDARCHKYCEWNHVCKYYQDTYGKNKE